MKTFFSKIALLLIVFTLSTAYSQEKTKKEKKEAAKIEKQKQLETLLNSKEFIFTAERAIPQGLRTVNLTSSDYFVKFHPQTIESHLPYYGRAYSGMPYGGDSGIMFNAAPTEYKLTKTKKDYQILATVKTESDTYNLNLSIGFDGYASLNVTSNKKSSISYSGSVSSE